MRTVSLASRRKQKAPRVLSYQNCKNCRDPKVKKKCDWSNGPWPNPCKRCQERNFPCSQPRLKADERVSISHNESLSTPLEKPIAASSEEHFATAVEGLPLTSHDEDHLNPDVGLHTSSHLGVPQLSVDQPRDGLEAPLSNTFDLSRDVVFGTPESRPDTQVDRVPSGFLNAERDQLLLQILPLHTIVLMASDEFNSIAENLIEPLKPDPEAWDLHAARTSVICSAYEQYASEIEKVISEQLGFHSETGAAAAFHLHLFYRISRNSRLASIEMKKKEDQKNNEIIEWYLNKGYHGMACALLMLSFTGKITDYQALTFIRSRQKYLKDFNSSHARPLLPEMNRFIVCRSITVEQFQLYVPGNLLKHSAIRDHVRETNSKDCLGRSVDLLEYDAGFAKTYGTTQRDRDTRMATDEDPTDFLGRTVLHAACVCGDVEFVDTFIKTEMAKCTTAGRTISGATTVSGLSVLHIAVNRVHFDIYRKFLQFFGLRDFLSSQDPPTMADIVNASCIIRSKDCSGRTFFEWAASHGHSHMVDPYLSDNVLRADLGLQPTHGTIIAAFRLAIRHNHLTFVQAMMVHLHFIQKSSWDSELRTAFWWAVHYKRFEVMLLVQHPHLVDMEDVNGRTPLMEAARQGFQEGVQYLLSLNADGSSKINRNAEDKNGMTASKLAEQYGHTECMELLAGSGT